MSLQNIAQMGSTLREAADQRRAKSKLTSSEYCMPVLGVVFLRHATNRYYAAKQTIEADQAAERIRKRAVMKADRILHITGQIGPMGRGADAHYYENWREADSRGMSDVGRL